MAPCAGCAIVDGEFARGSLAASRRVPTMPAYCHGGRRVRCLEQRHRKGRAEARRAAPRALRRFAGDHEAGCRARRSVTLAHRRRAAARLRERIERGDLRDASADRLGGPPAAFEDKCISPDRRSGVFGRACRRRTYRSLPSCSPQCRSASNRPPSGSSSVMTPRKVRLLGISRRPTLLYSGAVYTAMGNLEIAIHMSDSFTLRWRRYFALEVSAMQRRLVAEQEPVLPTVFPRGSALAERLSSLLCRRPAPGRP